MAPAPASASVPASNSALLPAPASALPRAPAPPLILPRGLIFLSSVWLIGSWLLAIGLRPPVQPSSASYTPAVREMLLCVTVGLMIGWPVLRLSQTRPPYPIRQTLLDLAVLLGLFQVVVWPLRLVTNWTPLRTAAIDATITGWLLLAAAVITASLNTEKTGPRALAMLACVAMCLAGPLGAWLALIAGVDAMPLVNLSPLLAVRTLGDGGSIHPTDTQWQLIALLGVAALASWVAVLIVGRGRTTEHDGIDHGLLGVSDSPTGA